MSWIDDEDLTCILVTYRSVPREFTDWMDQMWGDQWFMRQGKYTDGTRVTRVIVMRPSIKESMDSLMRLKFPQLFSSVE